MSIFKNLGDNRVKTAKNPEIQEMLDYMYNTYDAFIEAFYDRRETYYFVRCTDKKLFNFLYTSGMLDGGNIATPYGRVFRSKTEAYEGLVWLYNILEERENNKKRDEEWF